MAAVISGNTRTPEHAELKGGDDPYDRIEARSGLPFPLGVHESGGGANFALFSRDATRVRLELFDHASDAQPVKAVDFDPIGNRTGDVWHARVEGIHSGQLYAYRVDGPYQPTEGHRFNFSSCS
jgi:isoamylase